MRRNAGAQHSALAAEFRTTGEARPLSPAVELAIYRTVQEALTNVRKHSGARVADVVLSYAPDGVELRISDDGRGSTPSEEAGFGLRGLRERAELLGGELSIVGAPGFTVLLRIPG